MNILLTFKNTHLAIKCSKTLNQFNSEMIPTPREISSECGFSILVNNINSLNFFKDTIEYDTIYNIIIKGGEKKYEKIY